MHAELGYGSHAIVYRATDRLLGRDVALKVLRPELVNSDVSERFRREIRLTARLEHPHIARVYGTGEWDGLPYFVTALARGSSLADRLQREHQLPLDQAVRIVREIATALAYAHGEGVVHRDVKPANILLTADGALLTDFGVARVFQDTALSNVTSTGAIVGTVAYMSPEQICGEPVDERSDQYALALVLYEILAGVPPHVAATTEGLRGLRVLGQQQPVRTHRPSVPAVIDEILNQALSPAAADRFHSMAEFAAALDLSSDMLKSGTRFVAPAGPVRRSGETTATTAAMPRRPMPRAWIAGALAVVGVLTLGALALAKFRTSSDAAVPDADSGRFAIVADGDRTRTDPIMLALAAELGAWQGVTATTDESDGATVLATRVTPADGGITAVVTVRRPDGASQPAGAVQVHFPLAAKLDPDSLRILAARVLVASLVSPDSIELPYGVRQRPTAAVRQYASAWLKLRAGHLDEAERDFAGAAPTLPQAALWQALVGSWRQPQSVAAWRDVASEAARGSDALSPADSLLAIALQHRAADRIGDGIAALTEATRLAGDRFATWYTLGEALRFDDRVIVDRTSPTGARFASSWWAATEAYRRAIELLPTDGLVTLFSHLPTTAFALNGSRRAGRLVDDGEQYAGLPSASGDTVLVFPMPVRVFTAGSAKVPDTYQRAIRTGRARLLQLATALARRAPRSVVAQLAYARALEYSGMLTATSGTTSALSTLDSATKLARTREDSLDAGTSEMRVRLRLGDFAGARSVSTRLLQQAASASPDAASRLASIAMLVGRAALAESLLVRANALASNRSDGVPEAVATAIARYTIGSASGDCAALSALRATAVSALQSYYSRAELRVAVQRWITPGDWMRITCPSAPLPEGAEASDPLLRAVSALQSGQASSAGAAIRAMAAGRDGASTSAVAWDTRYAELWLLVQAGDTVSAREQLGGALDEISATLDYILFDLAQGAGLRRSLAMCGDIAVPGSTRPSREKCRDALRALSGG